jgi:hypothetical protein
MHATAQSISKPIFSWLILFGLLNMLTGCATYMKVQSAKIEYHAPDFPTHFSNSKKGGMSIGGQLSVNNQESVDFERKFTTKTTVEGWILDTPYSDSFTIEERTGTHSIRNENYGISVDLTKQFRTLFFSVLGGASLDDIALKHIGMVFGLSRNMGLFTPTIAAGGFYSHFREEQRFIRHSPSHTDLNGIWFPDSSKGKNSVLNLALKIGLMGRLNEHVFPYISYTLSQFDFEPDMYVVDTGSDYAETKRDIGLFARTHSYALGVKYKWSKTVDILFESAYVDLVFPSTYRSYHFSSSIRLAKDF